MTAAQKLADRLASHEHVLRATAIGRNVTVTFPRERGGRATLTLPAAKRLADRLGV
jgi:hypothetical protein